MGLGVGAVMRSRIAETKGTEDQLSSHATRESCQSRLRLSPEFLLIWKVIFGNQLSRDLSLELWIGHLLPQYMAWKFFYTATSTIPLRPFVRMADAGDKVDALQMGQACFQKGLCVFGIIMPGNISHASHDLKFSRKVPFPRLFFPLHSLMGCPMSWLSCNIFQKRILKEELKSSYMQMYNVRKLVWYNQGGMHYK